MSRSSSSSATAAAAAAAPLVTVGEQRAILEDVFRTSKMYPGRSVMDQLAHDLNMSLHRVRTWFNSRRAQECRQKLISNTTIRPRRARPIVSTNIDDGFTSSARLLDLKYSDDDDEPMAHNRRATRRQTLPVQIVPGRPMSRATLTGHIEEETARLLHDRSDSDDCWSILLKMVNKSDRLSILGNTEGFTSLSAIAHQFARWLIRTDHHNRIVVRQFAIVLANRLLYAILRTPLTADIGRDVVLIHVDRFVSSMGWLAHTDLPWINRLPGLVQAPWPAPQSALHHVMNSGTVNAQTAHQSRELSAIAIARLDILQEMGRYDQVSNLARFYLSGGTIDHCAPMIDRLVGSLVQAGRFDAAVQALLDCGAQQGLQVHLGNRVINWAHELVQAGASKHAERLLQVLSTSDRS